MAGMTFEAVAKILTFYISCLLGKHFQKISAGFDIRPRKIKRDAIVNTSGNEMILNFNKTIDSIVKRIPSRLGWLKLFANIIVKCISVHDELYAMWFSMVW